jgi:hypothetical protein
MKNTMNIFMGLIVLLTSLAGLFFMVGVGQAATYNFYFNNLEQGDNSSAKPVLKVFPKKGKEKIEKKTTLESTKTETVETENVETEEVETENVETKSVEVKEAVPSDVKVPEALVAEEETVTKTADENEEVGL